MASEWLVIRHLWSFAAYSLVVLADYAVSLVYSSPSTSGETTKIDTVDRFLFRDQELENICRQLCREVSLRDRADRCFSASTLWLLRAQRPSREEA